MGQVGADDIERFGGIGQRQEIVGIEPGCARPAQVIGHEQRFDLVHQAAQTQQVIRIQPMGGSNGQRNAVQRDRIARTHLVQDAPWPSARNHEILGNHLDKVHRHGGFEKVGVMRFAQAEAETGKAGVRHDRSPFARRRRPEVGRRRTGQVYRGSIYLGSVRLPPAALQALTDRALKPWPLQSFWPLQS